MKKKVVHHKILSLTTESSTPLWQNADCEQNGLYLFSNEVFHSIVTNNFNYLSFVLESNTCVWQRSVREIKGAVSPYLATL